MIKQKPATTPVEIDKALRRFEKLHKPKPTTLTRFVTSIDRQLDKLLN